MRTSGGAVLKLAQDVERLLQADGAERLGGLVPHHGILTLIVKNAGEGRDGGRVLQLSEHVGELVAEKRRRLGEAAADRLQKIPTWLRTTNVNQR